MLKVTQKVWGRGRFDSKSHDLWHFTLALDCASEAAKYLGFMDHIMFDLSSLSAPALLLPSSVLLHSTQPCNPETPLVQPFPHVWNGLFACLTPWWDKISQMAKIGVIPVQSLNSSHMPGYTQKVLKMSSGNGIRSSWGLWGICCMVYGICMVG